MNIIPNESSSLNESGEDFLEEHIFIYTGVKKSKHSDSLLFKFSDSKINGILPLSGLPQILFHDGIKLD